MFLVLILSLLTLIRTPSFLVTPQKLKAIYEEANINFDNTKNLEYKIVLKFKST